MMNLSHGHTQCPLCMENHALQLVRINESSEFKQEEVFYNASYYFCEKTEEMIKTEEQIKQNNIAVKDAYRSKVGLLTSSEIKELRSAYGFGQKELAELLGWGGATIARYETYQIQDRAHDDILRIAGEDPFWLHRKLKSRKSNISEAAYSKYHRHIIRFLHKEGQGRSSAGHRGIRRHRSEVPVQKRRIRALLEKV